MLQMGHFTPLLVKILRRHPELNVCPHRKLRGVRLKSVPYCSVQILHSKTSVWGSWGKGGQKVNHKLVGWVIILLGELDARFIHAPRFVPSLKGPLQRPTTRTGLSILLKTFLLVSEMNLQDYLQIQI